MKEMSEVLAFLNKGIAAMDPAAPLLRQTPMLSMKYLFAIDVLSMLSMCYLCYLWNIYAIYGISMLSIKYYINSILTHRCAIYGISMLSTEYLCYRQNIYRISIEHLQTIFQLFIVYTLISHQLCSKFIFHFSREPKC